MSKEKRKLALRLVEHVDNWIQRNGELDVDAAAEELTYLIPSTRAEAEAEFEELFHVHAEPSQFAQLREALNLNDCAMTDVLKTATEVVLHLNKVRQTPYNTGSLALKSTCNSWLDYIRYLLQEAHEYYIGGAYD